MAENSPKTAADLFAFLDGLGIAHTTKEHEPVYTVAESQSCGISSRAAIRRTFL